MLLIKYFHTDKSFPSISPLEKQLPRFEKRSCESQGQKAKSICDSSQLTVSVEDLKFITIFGNSLYETPEISA